MNAQSVYSPVCRPNAKSGVTLLISKAGARHLVRKNLSREDDAINWLSAENQVGFILPKELTKALYREVLGRQRESPILTISRKCVRIGEFHYTLSTKGDKAGTAALRQLLENPGVLHLYLTSHFLYHSGTRIITFSHKQPLAIFYKQVRPMYIELT